MSDDDNQILVPQSFIDPHRGASGRLLVPVAQLRERYELCEDLANHLVEHAQTLYHVQAPSEAEILRRKAAKEAADAAAKQAELASAEAAREAQLTGQPQG